MKNPATTWRVRRIGRTLWPSIRAHDTTTWLVIERARRAAVTIGTTARDRRRPADRSIAVDAPRIRKNGRHWLAALRLGRAACAAREPG